MHFNFATCNPDAADTTPPLHKQLRGTTYGIRSDELARCARTGERTNYIANKLLGSHKVLTHANNMWDAL